ncbi:F0F1 ATP synthase subunit gamma [Patescibacteria group bacterium]|nr:F0F1 ATP synthase subunit gamma [Patescibacteria group bacterium]
MIALIDPIHENIKTGETIRIMAEAYSELSVSRLNRIRVKIERNRLFALDLAQAFHEVRAAASIFNFKNKPVRKPKLNVLLFSNHGYFLSLETQMVRFFREQGDDGDILVIGRSGAEIFAGQGYTKHFDILIFPTDLPRSLELAKASERLKGYDRVSVFYPQFKTVATQIPVSFDITGDLGRIEKTNHSPAPAILEPEAPKMLEFFEGQIVRLLLEQAFLEAELARTAARLLMMDSTQNRARDYIRAQEKVLRTHMKEKQEGKILELSLGFLARKRRQF